MKKYLSFFVAGLSALTLSAHAVTPANRDADIRAAMVLNFVRFAEWSDSKFASAQSPVVMCVDSAEQLAPSLLTLKEESIANRPLEIRSRASAEFDASCHVAFLAPSSQSPMMVRQLHQWGVLTIGDDNGFSQMGAIELVQVGRQVRFEINNTAARSAGVHLSSRLLRLAVAVR